MKLVSIGIYRYSLPLRRPLPANQGNRRDGLIVEIRDENGHRGFGECAPLPGFNQETLAECEAQLNRIAFGLGGSECPDNLEELSGGFVNWLQRYDSAPSVRFAVETAVLSLLAKAAGRSLSQLMCDNPRSTIAVNALLSGDKRSVLGAIPRLRQEGFRTFKLKVGNPDLAADIELTRAVRKAIGDKDTLRLDANRKWSVQQAIDFWMATEDIGIEYIEEPVPDHSALVREITKVGLPSLITTMLPPTALDESLVDLDPDRFVAPPGVKALILKPTLLGFEPAMKWARRAVQEGLTPVVTSTFESSVGVSALVYFAACVATSEIPMGLATLDYFDEDILQPGVTINAGAIQVSSLPDLETTLMRSHLVEVTHE